MPKIAIAGFQHETNSYGSGRAGLAEFEMADSWPGLVRGPALIEKTYGMNLPIAGFVAAARAKLCPILWCAAEPSGPVTLHAFDTITQQIVDGLCAAGSLDAIYLDLHGAMITETCSDGEGALLERIRVAVGFDVPIAVSLDMHANLSGKMVELCDVICIYKTYPHLDMSETGARCWHRLQPLLGGLRPSKAFRRGPNLIPLHAQQTGSEPASGLYAALPDAAKTHVEMAFGFTAGDTPDVGPSLIAFAPDQEQADRLADAALARLSCAHDRFGTALASPSEAVETAMQCYGDKPVVLADVQDNPGAGASSDTTGIIRALISAGAQRCLVGLLHDPNMAQKAHDAGTGAIIEGALGGRSGLIEDSPFMGRFKVLALSNGVVRYTGAMYGGGHATLGESCALRIEDTNADVTVVVTSIRNQCLDLAQFTHFGLDPSGAKIVVVKSTAHFRADFEPIAQAVIPVSAPGLFPCAPPFETGKRRSIDTSV